MGITLAVKNPSVIYTVEPSSLDASRPWAVIGAYAFRGTVTRRCVGRYETAAKANRYRRDLTRRNAV